MLLLKGGSSTALRHIIILISASLYSFVCYASDVFLLKPIRRNRLKEETSNGSFYVALMYMLPSVPSIVWLFNLQPILFMLYVKMCWRRR